MNYQDKWILKKCIQRGDRECEKRYDIILSLINNKYHRPFTIIDIGANIGYFSIRIAEDFPSSCIVAVEPFHYQDLVNNITNNRLNNIIVLRKPFNMSIIDTLSTCEHFDVILFLSTLHNINDDMKSVLNSVLKLGDTHIIELAIEKRALGDRYEEGMKIFVHCESYWNLLGLIDSHVDPSVKRPMYDLEHRKEETKYSRYGKSYVSNAKIDSSAYDKIFQSIRKNEKRDWIPGINLWTYICLDGIYPSRQDIAMEIEKLDLSDHNDIRPWNFIINGQHIYQIDSHHPGNQHNITKKENEKYKEDLLNYIRGTIDYPKYW